MSTTMILSDSRPHAEPVTTTRPTWLGWAGVLVGLFLLQWIYFTGVISSDDMGYLAPAVDSRDGHVMTPETIKAYDCHFFARFVHWKLVQAAVTILPHQPWALALPSLIATLLTSLIVYQFASRFFSRRVGFVAMVLFGITPVVVNSASVAVPDPLAGLLAWVGVFLAATAFFDANVTVRAAVLRCVLAGAVIAAGYNAKEIVSLLIPAMILGVIILRQRDRRRWWGVLGLCIGAGIGLAIEALVLWRWTGDWLFHAHGVMRSHRGYEAPPIYPSLGGHLQYFSDYVRWMVHPMKDFGFVGPILLIGCAWAIWKRTPLTVFLLIVTSIPFAYLTVGTTDILNYQPIVHQPRYLVPLLPGMTILAGAMLVRIWEGCGPRMRQAMLLATVPMILVTLTIPNRLAGRWYYAASFTAAHDLFANTDSNLLDDAPILTSHFSANRFEPLGNWLDLPGFERLTPPFPATPEEWVSRYPGRIVGVTIIDRRPPSKGRHEKLTLYGPAADSLASFERIAEANPPRDRLSQLSAAILGHAVPVDSTRRVELVRIPDASR